MKFNLYIQDKLVASCYGWKSIYDMVMSNVYGDPHPDNVTEEMHINCVEAESWGELSAYEDGYEYEVEDFTIVDEEE